SNNFIKLDRLLHSKIFESVFRRVFADHACSQKFGNVVDGLSVERSSVFHKVEKVSCLIFHDGTCDTVFAAVISRERQVPILENVIKTLKVFSCCVCSKDRITTFVE